MKATIYNPSFTSLSKNDCVEAAIKDIENEVFGRQFIVSSLLCFFALKAFRYCDSNLPAMDKIYFLVKEANEAFLE